MQFSGLRLMNPRLPNTNTTGQSIEWEGQCSTLIAASFVICIPVKDEQSVQGWIYIVGEGEANAFPPICPRCEPIFEEVVQFRHFDNTVQDSEEQARS